MRIASANGQITGALAEGVACMVLVGKNGECTPIQLPSSLVAPKLSHLLSVNDLRSAGVSVHFPAKADPYLQTED